MLWERLTQVVNDRFHAYLDALPGETPRHRVEFSRRITTSWALIYYRRHLVRLSPFLFLLPASQLKHQTHWQELDATLRHEAAHAWLYARTGETGHSERFHDALAALGVHANGGCDLGPENEAFRYVYGCDGCGRTFPRRVPLRGNYSCAACSPGRFDAAFRLQLREELPPPAERLTSCMDRLHDALAEAFATQAEPRRLAPIPRAR